MLVTKKKNYTKTKQLHPTFVYQLDCKLTDAIFRTVYILITFAELILFWLILSVSIF